MDPTNEPKHLWSFKMSDAVLAFLAEVKDNKVHVHVHAYICIVWQITIYMYVYPIEVHVHVHY